MIVTRSLWLTRRQHHNLPRDSNNANALAKELSLTFLAKQVTRGTKKTDEGGIRYLFSRDNILPYILDISSRWVVHDGTKFLDILTTILRWDPWHLVDSAGTCTCKSRCGFLPSRPLRETVKKKMIRTTTMINPSSMQPSLRIGDGSGPDGV